MTDAERALLHFGNSILYFLPKVVEIPIHAQEAVSAWLQFMPAFKEWEQEVKAREREQLEGVVSDAT